ncbi:MAG: succinate dehydrogenase assembly factor 2 [Rickettsiales bacterium]
MREAKENIVKKAIYRGAHRGCRETDALFMRIPEKHIYAFSDATLTLYEQFLDESDYDIFPWLTGQLPLPSPYADDAALIAALAYCRVPVPS